MSFVAFRRSLVFAAALMFVPLVSAASLPDFTALVEKQGAAVVNISAIQVRGERPQSSIPFPELDESDPMFDFFRKFIPRIPEYPGPDPDNQSLGSGFIISPDGYILTNAHVVEEAEEIKVRLADKREYTARVIGADVRSDVALIKIEASDLPHVVLGDPERLKVGEWVVAIGSPFGFDQSVTAGIVSAKGRSLPDENFVPFIQTDVAINPGNSGGPLFNLRGEVVGINSQIYSRTGGFMGLSFAIPIDVVMDVQNQLRTKGRVQRGRIGVAIQEVTRDLADGFGLPDASGALVSSVEPGGPAARAGLLQGDVIVRLTGAAWRTPPTCRASSPRPSLARAWRWKCIATASPWRSRCRSGSGRIRRRQRLPAPRRARLRRRTSSGLRCRCRRRHSGASGASKAASSSIASRARPPGPKSSKAT